jgi:predicted metalloprotease with PDZ domain
VVNYKYDNPKNQPLASLGIRGQMAEGGFQIQNVWRGSAAEQAGISAGDVLMAVDGLKVSAQLEKTIASYAIGDTLNVHLFRRDELMQCQVVLQSSIPDFCSIQLSTESSCRHRAERWILGE